MENFELLKDKALISNKVVQLHEIIENASPAKSKDCNNGEQRESKIEKHMCFYISSIIIIIIINHSIWLRSIKTLYLLVDPSVS